MTYAICAGGCEKPVIFNRARGSLTAPICRECRRRLATRTCAYEPCGREFRAASHRTRFCSRACFVATRRMYDDPRAGSKASARVRRLRHAETWDGVTDPQIFARDGWLCLVPDCLDRPINPSRKWPDPRSASIDHIVPLSRGGADFAPNKRAAHLICNIRKGDRIHPGDAPIITPVLAPLGVLPSLRPKRKPPTTLSEYQRRLLEEYFGPGGAGRR